MDVNEYFLRTSLWPAFAYIVLTMVIGTIGNALVLIIYRNKFHRSVTWMFVYYLAVLDILYCLMYMPTELVLLANMMSFPSFPWCKISRYLSYIFHGSSCIVLMFIAFNRYDRICRSSNQWMNLKKARIICIGIFVFVAVIDIPSLLLYGEARVPLAIQDDTVKIISREDMNRYLDAKNRTKWQTNTTITNSSIPEILIGKMCFVTSEYSNSILLTTFFFMQFILFIILVVFVIYFYTKVIKQVIGYRSQQERRFKIYIPDETSRPAVKDETYRSRSNSDGVTSSSLCKDRASDPLSEESYKTEFHTGNGEINNLIADVCEIKNNQPSSNDPTEGSINEQAITGLEITFPVSDTKHLDDSHSNSLKSSKCTEINKLLSRRIKSAEILNKSINTIPSLMVPYILLDVHRNSSTPVLLHACEKRQTKVGKYESDTTDLKTNFIPDGDCSDRILDTRDEICSQEESQLQGYISKSMDALSPSIVDPLKTGAQRETSNQPASKGNSQCVFPLSGHSVKPVISHDPTDASDDDHMDPRRREDIEATTKIESHNVIESLRKNKSQDNITTVTEDKSTEAISESNPDLSESNPENENDHINMTKLEENGRDRKKFVAQPSVTFSEAEEEDAAVDGPRRKSSRLDSVSSLIGTPRGWKRLSSLIINRSSSSGSPGFSTHKRRMSVRSIKAHRTSVMLLSISLAFILSFLPFWIIGLTRAVVGSSFVPSLTPTTFGLVHLFIRSSYISNVVNPFVYGLINSHFRQQCKAIFRKR